jgi:hypothetical protein
VHVGPFCLGNRTFDDVVVDLMIIISAMSFGFKIGIGASSDCADHVMGWESFDLLLGFLDLWWRWWLWVGFCFYLGVCVILCWRICYARRICYPWRWRGLWMIGCGIVVG